jgi:tripartite-type tricarboxylate transporter receptor subunit TctC
VLFKKLSYDFVADFAPVIHVMRSPILLMVHPSVPAKTVPEFIAYAKVNPDKLSMGSGGIGSSGHMAGELFMMQTGVRMVHVPYHGESVGMTDFLAGQPQVMFATSGSALSFVKAGARSLACSTGRSISRWPNRPSAGVSPIWEASHPVDRRRILPPTSPVRSKSGRRLLHLPE